jgi:hypothetical protein
MDSNLTLPLCEDVIETLIADIHADEWYVNDDVIDADLISANDGFLPLWTTMAANAAVSSGLIRSIEEFPLVCKPTEPGESAFCLAVGLNRQRVPTEGTSDTDDDALSATVVCLLLMDSVHQAIAMNESSDLQANRRVNLSPALQLMEMSDEIEYAHGPRL